MAWGKTEDEKRADAAAKAKAAEAAKAATAERQRAEAEANYWASPVGQAVQAKQRGERFFQIAIPISTVDGNPWGSNDGSTTSPLAGATGILGQIEDAGWHLEHASSVFIETGTSSRDKMLGSGQQVATTGRVEGIYLFRATS